MNPTATTPIESVAGLGPFLPYLALALAILGFAIIIWLVLYLRGQARKARPTAPDPSALEAERAAEIEGAAMGHDRPWLEGRGGAPLSLRASFTTAMDVLRRYVSGADYRYGIPWFALIGAEGSAKSAFLRGAGVGTPMGAPTDGEASSAALSWWFFDQAVVLDVAEDLVLRHDGSANEGGWHALLSLLNRFRPKRPLDGVILAIPATDLIGDQRPRPEQLAEKYGRIQRKLWQMQKQLGVVLPLTVVITKADAIPGFSGFFSSLRPERRREMFGWASPYPVEAAYGTTWIEEAFGTLTNELVTVQLALAANTQPGPGMAEGLVLFPGQLPRLKEGLRIALDEVLRPSAYHLSFSLRGIFFTGALAQEDELSASQWVRPILVRDLLERKIFREGSLARPAPTALLGRTRRIRQFQIASAAAATVFGIGLWFSADRMQGDFANLDAAVGQVAEDLRAAGARRNQLQADGVRGPGGEAIADAGGAVFQTETATRLLTAMARIKTSDLTYIFIPPSWFSDVDSRVESFITLAFDRIILEAMNDQLTRQTERLLDVGVAPVGMVQAGQTDVAPTVEAGAALDSLIRFVDALTELERHIQLYNNLDRSSAPQDIAKLARFLFGANLPEGFFNFPEFYQAAIKNVSVRRIDVADYRARAAARVRELGWAVYNRLSYDAPLLSVLEELVRALRAVERSPGNPEQDSVTLRALLDALDTAAATLSRPETAWAATGRLDLGPALTETLGRITASSFLGPQVASDLVRDGDGELQRFRLRLGAYASEQFGPVLARQAGTIQLALSSDLARLRGALKVLFGQDFMSVRPPVDIAPRDTAGTRLSFNPARLDEVIRLYRGYDRFLAQDMDDFPASLQVRVRDLAVGRLDGAMRAALAAAVEPAAAPTTPWRGGEEEEITADVRNLASASESLGTILTVLRQIERFRTYEELYRLVLDHSYGLLQRVDRLVESEGLYRPDPSVREWDGRRPVIQLAFNANDDVELQNYLQLQRERLAHILEAMAAPILSILALEDFNRDLARLPLITRWQRISRELTQYLARRPGSTLVTFERFVRFDLSGLTVDNCRERLRKAELAGSGDFFLSRRDALLASLRAVCDGLHGGNDPVASALPLYDKLTDQFDRALAGRFPFTEDDAPRGADMGLDDLRAFFRYFDPEADKVLLELEGAAIDQAQRQRSQAFVVNLKEVRKFLAPLLALPAGPTPEQGPPPQGIGVGFDFRVNRGFEINANQILEWRIDLGAQRLGSGGSAVGSWRFGDPVTLRLRWAKDSPLLPTSSSGGMPRIEGSEIAAFSYTDRWALISMLRRHALQPGEFDPGTPPALHTLSFTVPTAPRSQALNPRPSGGGLETAPLVLARVFLRLALTAPGAAGAPGGPLVMPEFPTRAPKIDSILDGLGAPPATGTVTGASGIPPVPVPPAPGLLVPRG